MKWLRGLSGLAAVVFLCAQAPAENTVMSNYRAYRSALEAGDLATAETAADAALQLSVARDGQGGRTGVLALNLAQVRLQRERFAEAYAPALQAFEIAQSNAESGVDPLLARLTLGRAELTDDRLRQGRSRIEAALSEATARPDVHADAYHAASDLGRKLVADENLLGAASAWSEAVRFADLMPGDTTYVRAEARLGYGVAQFWYSVGQQRESSGRDMDSNLGINPTRSFGPARDALIEAQNAVAVLAHQPGADMGITGAQRIFASAQAWRALIDAYLEQTQQREVLNRIRGSAPAVVDPFQGDNTICSVNVGFDPRPEFPGGARAVFTVGTVVLRISVDQSGQVTDTRVVSAIPERWFADAVSRVAPQWPVTRSAESPANCRMPPVLFHVTRFTYGQ
jgi:hypothetical protein